MTDPVLPFRQRVAPVVGRDLEDRALFLGDLEITAPIGEALWRVGVTRQMHDGAANVLPAGPLALALGRDLEGKTCAEALAARCIEHGAGQIEVRFSDAREPPDADLWIAGSRFRTVIESARAARIPALCLGVLGGSRARAFALIALPDAPPVDPELLDRLDSLTLAAAHPDLAGARRADLLDVQGFGLAIAQALLLRGRAHAHADLDAHIDGGRTLLLRGDPVWPFAVRFVMPAQWAKSSALDPALPSMRVPASLTARARVMILGCGTASLAAGMLAPHVGALLLADAKPFSPYNPVRQLAGVSAIGRDKATALCEILARRLGDPDARRLDGALFSQWQAGSKTLAAAHLLLKEHDAASIAKFRALLDAFAPDLVIVGMGRSRDDNFTACEILRARGIAHIVPTAFPGASHWKHIFDVASAGPCYACLQAHLPVDRGAAPQLSEDARELYYGGTQPATMAETLPSAASLTRITLEMCRPKAARSPWFLRLCAEERTCLVGANRIEDPPLFGIPLPFQVVAFGARDVMVDQPGERCTCGRILGR